MRGLITAVVLLLTAIPFYGQAVSCKICACGEKKCVSMCLSSGSDMTKMCVAACVKHDEAIMCPVHAFGGIPDADLTHFYEAANDSYFDGKLPKNLIVYDTNMPGRLGQTSADGSSFRIDINLALNPSPKESRLTLYHEMCHIYTWQAEDDKHGPRWVACMHNLALQGAFDDLW